MGPAMGGVRVGLFSCLARICGSKIVVGLITSALHRCDCDTVGVVTLSALPSNDSSMPPYERHSQQCNASASRAE